MHPTEILVSGRPVDRRPALLVALLGAVTVGSAVTVKCPLSIRLSAIAGPVAIVAAVLIASRATNVVIRRGPLLYVKDSRSNRLVPAPSGARIVCATTRGPNVLLLDAQGRTLAAASMRCPPDDLRRRLEPAGIAVEVW